MESKKEKKQGMKMIKKLGIFLKPFRLSILFICICGIIYSFSNAFVPVLEANVISSITSQKFDTAVFYAIAIFAVGFALEIVIYFYDKVYSRTWTNIVGYMSKSIAKEALKVKLSVFDNRTTGEFMTRIDRDPARITSTMNQIRNGITSLVTNLGVFIYICFINIYFAFAFLIVFIISMIITKKRTDKKIALRKQINVQVDKRTSILTEMVRGIRDIKLLNLKEHFQKDVDSKIDAEKELTYQADKTMFQYNFIIDAFYHLFYIFILLLGIYLTIHHKVSLANFIVIYMYRNRPQQLAFNVSNMIEQFREMGLSCERMFSVFEHTEYAEEKFGKTSVSKFEGHIEFENVKFQYGDKTILEHFSLNIKPNQTVAIVGATGAGKSTIFQALTRSYDIQDGTIRIDEIPITDLTEETLRNNISIIHQSPYIFNMSIRDNLKLVKEDLTEEEMIQVCKEACLDEFVQKLEDKYDTIVGEGGITLSGGERQRLAIARALLKKSEIILFDEATSALDNNTQSQITKAIHNISNEYTILIIAHRLSTIKECNRILVIDHGKIVGDGTHQELLENNHYYQALYEQEIEK
ncbi:MAG: ABC transporter ATP-binding protein [Firmicutes bacterium]|nr:ABC transporter ATP-binding protein [Bacillota bacterium]